MTTEYCAADECGADGVDDTPTIFFRPKLGERFDWGAALKPGMCIPIEEAGFPVIVRNPIPLWSK